MDAHYINHGDTLTPLGMRLKQADDNGDLQDVSLVGKTVKVVITEEDGTIVVAETTIGVTVVTASEGKVQYDFQGGANLLAAGTYLIWVRVYSGAEYDTYPVSPDQMRIIVTDGIDD